MANLDKTRRLFIGGGIAAILLGTIGTGCNDKADAVQQSTVTTIHTDSKKAINKTPETLEEKTSDDIVGLNLNKNIAYLALDIERQYHEVPDSAYQLLDRIIETAKNDRVIKRERQNINSTNSQRKILKRINHILTKDFGYKNTKLKERNEKLITFSEAMIPVDGKRYKDCDTGSLIYLAIAEEIGMELDGVRAPAHFFVRMKNGTNFDTLDSEIFKDKKYKRKISEESIKNGTYLKSLSKEETLAGQYVNLGKKLADEKRFQEAFDCFDKAKTLGLDNAYSNLNLGNTLGKFAQDSPKEERPKLYEKAKAAFNKAIEQDPQYDQAYFNRGLCSKRLEEYDNALADFRKANDLGNKNPNIKKNIDFCMEKRLFSKNILLI